MRTATDAAANGAYGFGPLLNATVFASAEASAFDKPVADDEPEWLAPASPPPRRLISPTIPETVMLNRAAARARLADAIAADYTTLARELIAACPAPPGHRWDVSRGQELHWWSGDVVESTRFGASIFIRRDSADDYDPEQVHVEVRWFPRHPDSDQESRRQRHTAILWCEKGLRIGGFRNLLDAKESFPKAATVEELAAIIAATLRRILWS